MTLTLLLAAIVGLQPIKGDNTPQVVEAVSRLGNGDTLQFAKGEYHFYEGAGADVFVASPGSLTGMKKVLVHLKGLKNVTVDGGGAHFVFHENVFPFVFENCEDVKLRGFRSDAGQLPVVEFTCVEKSPQGFLCRFAPGSIPHSVDAKGVISFAAEGGVVSSEAQEISTHALKWCQIHYLCGPDCRRNKDTLASTFFTVRAEDRGDGSVFFRYFAESHPKHVDAFPFPTGEPLAFLLGCRRICSLAAVRDCRRVTVEDVHAHSGAGMGLVFDMCEDVCIRRYRVKPDEGRFVSLTADSMFIVDCKGKVEIDSCESCWGLDDAMNIHGNYTEIQRIEGTRIRVRHPHQAYGGYFPYRTGERLEFSTGHGSGRKTLGFAEVARFDVPADREAREFEIVLDREIPSEWRGCNVANVSHVPAIHIHDCNFHDYMHLRLSAFADVVFENNRLENGNNVLLIDDLSGYWGECGPIHSLTVRNNDIGRMRNGCFMICAPVTGRVEFRGNRLSEGCRKNPFFFGGDVSAEDRAKFRLEPAGRALSVYNLDSTHYTYEYGDDKMNAAGLREYVHRVLGAGAFTHFFICPGAQTTLCDTKTMTPTWWRMGEPGVPLNDHMRRNYMMHTNGVDAIGVEIDAIRAHGVSPWLSMRMNDNHDANDPKSWLHSRFWVEHPEYRKQGGFDYSVPAVRDYHLAFVEEMLARYDVDGFECDWMRWPIPQDAAVLTAFMRRVRAATAAAAKRRGHPILLGARVASRPGRARSNGTDAVLWAKEGLVDWIVPANFFSSVDFDLPVDEWLRLVREAGASATVVPCLDTGVVTCDPKTGRRSPRRMLTLAEYCGWAKRMYDRGAPGVYYFNLFTYFEGAYKTTDTAPWNFIVGTGLTPESVKGQPQSIPDNWWYEP